MIIHYCPLPDKSIIHDSQKFVNPLLNLSRLGALHIPYGVSMSLPGGSLIISAGAGPGSRSGSATRP